MKDKKGIVYILTNPSLDGWVKIGMTNKNEMTSRLRELNSSTAIPLSFRVFAEYHIDDAEKVEKKVHKIIDEIDDSLRSNEYDKNHNVIRQREFYQIEPEKAFDIFYDIADLRNDTECLKKINMTKSQKEEEEIANYAKRGKWTAADFFDFIKDKEYYGAVREIYEFCEKIGGDTEIVIGRGQKSPSSFGLLISKWHKSIAFFNIRASGQLWLKTWLDDEEKNEDERKIAKEIFGGEISEKSSSFMRDWKTWYPKIREFENVISQIIKKYEEEK